MIRRPPRSTPLYSSAASDVYKRQGVPRSSNVGDYVTVLADLRRHLPMLEGVQEHHLPTYESPWCSQGLGEVEKDMPQLVHRVRKRRQGDCRSAHNLPPTTRALSSLSLATPPVTARGSADSNRSAASAAKPGRACPSNGHTPCGTRTNRFGSADASTIHNARPRSGHLQLGTYICGTSLIATRSTPIRAASAAPAASTCGSATNRVIAAGWARSRRTSLRDRSAERQRSESAPLSLLSN